MLECGQIWCVWDENIYESEAYHLVIPEWGLYHRLLAHIGLQAPDLVPMATAAEESQAFVHFHHDDDEEQFYVYTSFGSSHFYFAPPTSPSPPW